MSTIFFSKKKKTKKKKHTNKKAFVSFWQMNGVDEKPQRHIGLKRRTAVLHKTVYYTIYKINLMNQV